MKILSKLLLLVVLVSAPVQAKDFVWRVAGAAGHDVYLVGSVHLLPPRAYPLPEAFEQAYQRSEVVMFETDMAAMEAPDTQFALLAAASYPPGQSLRDNVPPPLLARLEQAAGNAGLPMVMFERLKPWFAATLLELTRYTKAGFRPELGIDTHFFERASKDGKLIVGLEPLAEHMALLTEMTPAQSLGFLRSTLSTLESDEDTPARLFDYWHSGDAPGLDAYAAEQASSNPALQARLVDDRNHAWLEDIEALLAGNANAMVVVGALHLTGEQGLPALLRARGYTPEQQ